LYLDGRQIASVSGGSLYKTWHTTGTTGSHTLKAVAYDTSNNQASSSVTVQVN
jgi:hypothetical protein